MTNALPVSRAGGTEIVRKARQFAVTTDIERTLHFYHPDGASFELCGIGTERYPKAVDGGFFNDHAAALAAALELAKDHHAVYVTLNPVDEALLARANNRIKRGLARTKDSEVLLLRKLLVDVDPKRLSGTSSSEREHQMAIELCRTIQAELEQQGWPAPLFGDSGNGAHLVYCLPDLENTPENVELLKRCLRALAQRWNTADLDIDTSVFNPARISKAYGTWARKGDSTSERPHRLARILSVPEQPQCVTLEQLEALAAAFLEPVKPTSSPRSHGGTFDLADYLAHYGVQVKKTKPHKGGTLHVLQTCLFDEGHSDGEASIFQASDGKLFYQCFHNSCQSRTWHEARQKISGDDGLTAFRPENRNHPSRQPTNNEPPRPLLRELPPAEEYPVEFLGDLLGRVADRLHHVIRAPLALCAQSVLAAATLAVQPHANVELDGREIPLSEYFTTVGATGERKSAVDTEALRPHRAYEKKLRDEFADKQREYELANEAYRKAKEEVLKKAKGYEAKKSALKDLGQPPPGPLFPLLLMQEPTYEGLYKVLQAGRPSVGVFSDEGGSLIGGHAMNEDNRLKTAAGLSALWDGKPVSRVRGGDGAGTLYGRRVSFHLMVQPNVARLFLGDSMLIDQGLISRMLATWPQSTAGTRTYREMNLRNDGTMLAYCERLETLLAERLPVSDSSEQELAPRLLLLDPSAKVLWREFHDSVEHQLSDEGPLAPIRGFANKAAEHAVRLAGVLTLVDDLNARTISIAKMEAGIKLAEYYLTEALRLFHAGAVDEKLLLAERLLQWVSGHEVVHLRQIYQYGPNAIRDAKTAKEIVHVLVEHGWLVPVDGGREIDGTHRREVWEVRHV